MLIKFIVSAILMFSVCMVMFDSKTSSGVYDHSWDKQVFAVSGVRVVFVGFEYFCRKAFG